MRSLAIVLALAGTASAGPVLRVGAVGGYDTSAPGHKEDGLAMGVGYRAGGFTAQLDYAYLDYDGSTGVGGGSSKLGILLGAQFHRMECVSEPCPHFDVDVGAGRRSISWVPGTNSVLSSQNTIDRSGKELLLGLSVTMGWRFALHYVVFKPDEAMGPVAVCRGTCPMKVDGGDDNALLLEVSFAYGG